MNGKKKLGILGGMGPMATADLFTKIVAMTKANTDGEHMRILIDNHAQIPDRTAAILHGGESPLPYMIESLRNLEKCRVDCIVMPCNTAHFYLSELKDSTDIPFLSILEQTALACKAAYPQKTAGVLATVGTLKTGLYKNALAHQGVLSVEPDADAQERLMQVIYGVKAGRLPKLEDLAPVIDSMQKRGADYFILGCTELPIAFQSAGLTENLIDPTRELAKAAIQYCGYEVVDC